MRVVFVSMQATVRIIGTMTARLNCDDGDDDGDDDRSNENNILRRSCRAAKPRRDTADARLGEHLSANVSRLAAKLGRKRRCNKTNSRRRGGRGAMQMRFDNSLPANCVYIPRRFPNTEMKHSAQHEICLDS